MHLLKNSGTWMRMKSVSLFFPASPFPFLYYFPSLFVSSFPSLFSSSGQLIHHVRMGAVVQNYLNRVPNLDIEVAIQPITRLRSPLLLLQLIQHQRLQQTTRTVLRVQVTIFPAFEWDDRYHGKVTQNLAFIQHFNTNTNTNNTH